MNRYVLTFCPNKIFQEVLNPDQQEEGLNLLKLARTRKRLPKNHNHSKLDVLIHDYLLC
jgi:hypothetical protein